MRGEEGGQGWWGQVIFKFVCSFIIIILYTNIIHIHGIYFQKVVVYPCGGRTGSGRDLA